MKINDPYLRAATAIYGCIICTMVYYTLTNSYQERQLQKQLKSDIMKITKDEKVVDA